MTMSGTQVEYRPRTLQDWLRDLANGSLALPRFQRSYVWKNPKISDLIIALLRGHPVGTLLLIDRYVRRSTPLRERELLERFAPRSLSGVEADLEKCEELILDGQQRLTSLYRALEVEAQDDASEPDGTNRPAFLKVEDLLAGDLRPSHVEWPRPAEAAKLTGNPSLAAKRNYIPCRLLGPAATTPITAPETILHHNGPDALEIWCSDVTDNNMTLGNRLLRRINEQLRLMILGRNIWYVKLPASMNRSAAINVFVKVNESSAVIRRFDIAVAEFDSQGASLRDQIANWAEQTLGVDQIFGTDEETVIPKAGELMLKVACLQTGRAPTDRHYTSPSVLDHIGDDKKRQAIFDGISWTLEFLADEKIWTDKQLPSEVPLRVLPALFPFWQEIDDQSNMTGRVHRVLRAYLWRSFTTDRYNSAANTRLQDDFKGLRLVLEGLPEISGDPCQACAVHVPIFLNSLPDADKDLGNIDQPLAPPTRKDKLSRALLVASLHRGARDFGSGEQAKVSNVRARQAHHLFPRAFLKNHGITEAKQINHCLNYALVSAPTNKRIGAKPPIEYLKDRYRIDPNLAGGELKRRIESHLIPYGALSVRKASPAVAYKAFLGERARLMHRALKRLANGEPLG